MIDTAADYQAEAVQLAQQAAQYRHLTETAELAGYIPPGRKQMNTSQAPDPRVGEIEARLSAADAVGIEWSSLPALTDDDMIMFRVYDDEGHAIAECSDMAVASLAGHAPADVSYLLAELRKAHEALREAQEVAWAKGATSAGMNLMALQAAGINPNPYRAAVDAANGDGREDEAHTAWCRGGHEGRCRRGRLTGTEK